MQKASALRPNRRLQLTAEAREIVGILAHSDAARSRRLMRNPLGRHLNAHTALRRSKIAYTGSQPYAYSALKQQVTYGDSQNNNQSLPAWIQRA